ncbi:hypothetical protein WMY93_022509 [Mugilogobius chulae]|uniref:DH domain-containing protein n=1 Tax=Mugilogobius chulae TaxID=88201 RepID=A0AAW0NIC4_9GOBI
MCLSFLTPRDLCSVAQVCWNWRILAEQDCLWVSRCVRKGWFLPYTPAEKEYGAWKKHYVSRVSTLDWLTPREAQELYQRRGRATDQEDEDQEERRKERRIRDIIRDRLQQGQREVLRTRPAWGSSSKSLYSAAQPRMSLISKSLDSLSSVLHLSLEERPGVESRTGTSLEIRDAFCSVRSLSRSAVSEVASSDPKTLLLLISDALPAYEMVLSGVKAGVLTVLYDHTHTLSALSAQVERALSGHSVLRLGLLAPGGTEGVRLLQSSELSDQTLLAPEHKDFWEKMFLWIAKAEAGGGIDVFCPLAASATGLSLMQSLSDLTRLQLCAPMGLASGFFQNILGPWCDSSLQQTSSSALQYIREPELQSWCTQVQWAEVCLCELRTSVAKELQRFSAYTRGRTLGHYFQEKVCPKTVHMSSALNMTLAEGLTTAAAQEEVFMVHSAPLTLCPSGKQNKAGCRQFKSSRSDSDVPVCAQTVVDWRGAVVNELHQSEILYLSRLAAVHKVYQEPLTAALNSNSAIISIADILIILSPVSQILELNRVLQADLDSRLKQWSAQQCVGDVFVKFFLKLRLYTNYFNNYTTAVHTIDKCRETKPLFRAFLKRTDRTLATHMFSLQELLLCPLWRMQEYYTLLQALSLHTPPGHADHAHLSSAINTLKQYNDFLRQLKQNSQREKVMEETQEMIQGCPNLIEGNRQLVTSHKCALYRSPDEHLPDSLKALEQVADFCLFLFTDALVLTRLSLHHIPFSVAHSCSYTFVASVALSSLSVREINHSRYVSHAFVLEGPRRSWVCASDSALDRELFLCVLRTTIETALKGHR